MVGYGEEGKRRCVEAYKFYMLVGWVLCVHGPGMKPLRNFINVFKSWVRNTLWGKAETRLSEARAGLQRYELFGEFGNVLVHWLCEPQSISAPFSAASRVPM